MTIPLDALVEVLYWSTPFPLVPSLAPSDWVSFLADLDPTLEPEQFILHQYSDPTSIVLAPEPVFWWVPVWAFDTRYLYYLRTSTQACFKAFLFFLQNYTGIAYQLTYNKGLSTTTNAEGSQPTLVLEENKVLKAYLDLTLL